MDAIDREFQFFLMASVDRAMNFLKICICCAFVLHVPAALATQVDWEASVAAGTSAYEAKEWDQAQKHFEAAAEAAKDDKKRLGLALFYSGNVFNQLNNADIAVRQFRLAIASLQSNPDGLMWELMMAMRRLATNLGKLNKYDEAEEWQKRALSVAEKEFGQSSSDVGEIIFGLGFIYSNQKRHDDAVVTFLRALAVVENRTPIDLAFKRSIVGMIALTHAFRKDYVAALEYGNRNVALSESLFGANSAEVAKDLLEVVLNVDFIGNCQDCEAKLKRAIEILKSHSPPDTKTYVDALRRLSMFYAERNRYAESESAAERATNESKEKFGEQDPITIRSLQWLSSIYSMRGKYDQAARILDRLQDKNGSFTDYDEKAIDANVWLIVAKTGQGRFDEAEQLLRSVISKIETARGANDKKLSDLLGLLAYSIGTRGGTMRDVQSLFQRALAIAEITSGRESDEYAKQLIGIALAFRGSDRFEDAEAYLLDAKTIQIKLHGEKSAVLANTYQNLSGLYVEMGKPDVAADYARRGVEILESEVAPTGLPLARALSAHVRALVELNSFATASESARRAVLIFESTLGTDHLETVINKYQLAAALAGQERLGDSLKLVRQASRAFTAAQVSEPDRPVSEYHDLHLAILAKALDRKVGHRGELLEEAFKIGQIARSNSTARQAQLMSVRLSAGSDRLASLIRRYQDVLAHLKQIDGQLVEQMALPAANRNRQTEQQLRDEYAASKLERNALGDAVNAEFPRYVQLTSGLPIDLGSVQRILDREEALVSFLIGKKDSFVFVVRKSGIEFRQLPISKEDVARLVKVLRKHLDLGGNVSEVLGRPFDYETSNKLYSALFGQIEKSLSKISRLILVLDGPLQSLPFGVLITDANRHESPFKATWLAKRFAITVLPSISSLHVFRTNRMAKFGDGALLGFANPKLANVGTVRGITVAKLYARGSVADVDDIRQLASLPETEEELRAIASKFKGAATALYFQDDATESQIKSIDLSAYRRIAFATHGLMAGEFKGVQEPALVLTPPQKGTILDDGLLTASEVAQLKLNADWVILSACNTAAPDGTPGAEGLSGLAKAFIYAGARALLVSHWSIASEATVALTTRIFSEVENGRSKAVALKNAMLAMMQDANYAHPAFWAPFIVVGDGR